MPWVSLGQGDDEIWIDEEEKDPDTIVETEEEKENKEENEPT